MMNKFTSLPSLPNIRLGKQFPVIVARTITLCLLLLLMWALGRIAWIWVNPAPEIVFSGSFSSAPPEPKVESYQINELVEHNFFGVAQEANAIQNQPVSKNALPTQLNLTLVGLVASDNSNYALAVIGKSGVQQVYGIGETIKGSQATLRQVMEDRIILRNGGRDETLMLDGLKFEENVTTPKLQIKLQNPANSETNTDPLASVKAEILKNPQTLLKYITLSQQRDDEGVVGYRIGPGSDGRLFAQVGLRTDDLVVNINGADLRNPSEMAKVWQKLSDASEINLTVLRDGQEHNVLIGL